MTNNSPQNKIQSDPSTEPIIVKGNSNMISLGSGESQLPFNQPNKYQSKKNMRNFDED